MKHTVACSLAACLLAGLFSPVMAETYGPPAVLTVQQMPRVDFGAAVVAAAARDGALTPLPGDDSALPPEAAANLDMPPVAGAMPVAAVEKQPVMTADAAMPPAPTPIRNEAAPDEVKIAEASPVPASGPSALPFPPSAQDWAARMPLGGTKLAAAVPAPQVSGDREEAATTEPAPRIIHADERQEAQSSPELPAPGPPVRRTSHDFARNFSPDSDDMNSAPAEPEHIVVQAQAPECRGYTRTLGGSWGRQRAAGTACLGGDGVWRIAEEHLMTRDHAARMYVHAVAPPDYYSAPVQVYEPAYVVAGYGYGHRYYRGWR